MEFKQWATLFVKKITVTLTIFFIISMTISLVTIIIAIFKTGELSYLDTFISEISNVFKVAVIGQVVKSTIEGVYENTSSSGSDDSEDEETPFDEDEEEN